MQTASIAHAELCSQLYVNSHEHGRLAERLWRDMTSALRSVPSRCKRLPTLTPRARTRNPVNYIYTNYLLYYCYYKLYNLMLRLGPLAQRLRGAPLGATRCVA